MAGRDEWTLILKLRSNIEPEGDLRLAELEIARLLGGSPEPLDRPAFEALAARGALRPADLRHGRASGIVGYRVRVGRWRPADLFRRLSFVELVAGSGPLSPDRRHEAAKEFEDVPAGFIRLALDGDQAAFRLVPLYAALEWSDIIARHAASPDEAVRALERALALAREGQPPGPGDGLPDRAMSARLTTGHLFHGLHVYKAKFFPRLARALLNIYAPHADACVLDPYAGSGTALAEASILGMPAVGVDIDPLSALIASAKIQLARETGGETLENALAVKDRVDALRIGRLPLFRAPEGEAPGPAFVPPFLARRIPIETQAEMAEDISLVLSAIRFLDEEAARPLRVVLSDAISRKLKFRFLGLGYGRFALSIMPGRIVETFRRRLDELANAVAVWQWLRRAAGLAPAPAMAQIGDARRLPFGAERFDLIVTSPPYLPASSGRESYLKSKALAMIALGLLRAEEVEAWERRQIGSAHRSESPEGLPPKAREVVAWMAADEVRRAKAGATASYFADLARSFREIRRVLRPGGRCVMVIAKQHVFYRYRSREVVRVVDNSEIVSELAAEAGLEVEEAIPVELHKRNPVARPRSLDAYYETILVLRRP